MVVETLVWTEWLMVAVFIAGVVACGFVKHRSTSSLEGAFLAGRKIPGFVAALSTVATNMNAMDFIGRVGAIYVVGVLYVHFNFVNGLMLMLVSLLVVGKLRKMNVFTLGQWLENRYSPAVGHAYSITWAMVWMLFNLGLYIYGGALVLHTLAGWNLYMSMVVLTVIAAFYTLLGGFEAVVATDILQLALMFFPFIFLGWMIWAGVGNPAELSQSLPPEKMNFWAKETPFGSQGIMFFGMAFMALSYWSSEAQIIQRPLCAKSEEDACVAYMGTAIWFTILVPILISIPALAAIKEFPNLSNPDMAMPMLIKKHIPHGLYGVTVVGLIAGIFSSADSQINAFCAMFTSDIYKRLLRPGRSVEHYLKVSKIAGVVFTFSAIGTALWISKAEKGMMIFAISVVATIMPPFGAVTLVGVLVRRANSRGAVMGLVGGGVVAAGLAIASQLGYLAGIAEDTLFFRTMVAFLVTTLLVLAGSLPATDERAVEPAGEDDVLAKLTPRLVALVALLLAGIAGMYGFWSYYF